MKTFAVMVLTVGYAVAFFMMGYHAGHDPVAVPSGTPDTVANDQAASYELGWPSMAIATDPGSSWHEVGSDGDYVTLHADRKGRVYAVCVE